MGKKLRWKVLWGRRETCGALIVDFIGFDMLDFYVATAVNYQECFFEIQSSS